MGAVIALVPGAHASWAGDGFFTLTGHGGPIMSIAVGPRGGVATASFDNSVGLWSAQVPDWLEGHDAAVNCVIRPRTDLVFSGGDDFAVIRWDLGTGASDRMEGHKGKVIALALSPDARLLASASWDGTIGLWPLDGGEPRFLSGHRGPVNDVAFAPDGRLYSASADGSIRLWDTSNGQEMARVVEHGFGVNELVMGPSGDWIAYGAVDGGTRVLDLATGNGLADLTLDRRPILAMERNADGSRIAVGDGEGYIMVVDTDGWTIARDFRATQQGPVWAVAFSADGENIHAGGLDNRMYSWPIETMDAFGQMDGAGRTYLEDPAALPNGERQFKRKCSICHTLTEGSARRAGPSLSGLFGRRAGTQPDYTYSPALDGSDIVWSDATIDALFDIGPEHYIPGTKMPMQRITAAKDRADLIDYLKAETATNGKADQ